VIGVYAARAKLRQRRSAPWWPAKMAALAETASDEEIARAKAQLRSGLLMDWNGPARAPR